MTHYFPTLSVFLGVEGQGAVGGCTEVSLWGLEQIQGSLTNEEVDVLELEWQVVSFMTMFTGS
jgi:hypothetical protein